MVIVITIHCICELNTETDDRLTTSLLSNGAFTVHTMYLYPSPHTPPIFRRKPRYKHHNFSIRVIPSSLCECQLEMRYTALVHEMSTLQEGKIGEVEEVFEFQRQKVEELVQGEPSPLV